MRESKEPLAVFTQGKSIMKAVSKENPSGISLEGSRSGRKLELCRV